jgi:DNA-binding MarR family transcriptional regulator
MLIAKRVAVTKRRRAAARPATDQVEWLGELGQELSNATIAFHEAVAEGLGLHVTDHKALGYLYRHGPLPAGRLAELSGLTTGSATAMIDRLERAGYVKRERDPEDRRKVIVVIGATEDQLAAVRGMFAHMLRALGKHIPEYSQEEQDLLKDFMQRNIAALREATASLRSEHADWS